MTNSGRKLRVRVLGACLIGLWLCACGEAPKDPTMQWTAGGAGGMAAGVGGSAGTMPFNPSAGVGGAGGGIVPGGAGGAGGAGGGAVSGMGGAGGTIAV